MRWIANRVFIESPHSKISAENVNIYFSFGSISQHYKNYMHTEVLLAYCPTTGKIFNLSEKVPSDPKHKDPKFAPNGGTFKTYFGLIHLENWGLCICGTVLQ